MDFPARDDLRTGYEANLTEQQRAALAELKARIATTDFQRDVEGNPDGDRFVLRFLRATMGDKRGARVFDVDAAEARFKEALEFRRKFKADEIRERIEKGELDPDYVKYSEQIRPRLIFKDERTGRPVHIERFGVFMQYVDTNSFDEDGWLRMIAWDLEYKLHLLRQESRARGYEIGCYNVVFDLKGGGGMASMSRLSIFKALNHVVATCYPEILAVIMIVNAPWLFAKIFAFVKQFMDPDTISKVFVVDAANVTKMLEAFGKDRVPTEYGGMSSDVVGVPIHAPH